MANLAYAQLSRKDIITYIPDFYSGQLEEAEEQANQQAQMTTQGGQKKKAVQDLEKNKLKVSAKQTKAGNLSGKEQKGRTQNYIKNISNITHPRPYFIVKEEFDDNLYNVKKEPLADYTTKLYPGLEFSSEAKQSKRKQNKKLGFYLNTGLQVLRYSKEDEHNHESPYGRGFLRFGRKRVSSFTSASSNYSRGTISALTDGSGKGFIDSWSHEFGQDFKIDLNKFDIGMQYNRTINQYHDAQFKSSDRIRDMLAMRNSLKITPKTKLFLEYAHGWADYYNDTSSSYSWDRYSTGLNGRIFKKLEGLVKIGYVFNKEKTLKDINGPSVSGALVYKASPHLAYNLNFVKGIGSTEMLTEAVAKIRGVNFGLSYLPAFNRKVRLTSKIYYSQTGSDYQTRDNILTLSFKSEYKFRQWLTCGLEYNFEDRTSKTDSHDYRNNIVTVSLASQF
jgi:hypothetical protein